MSFEDRPPEAMTSSLSLALDSHALRTRNLGFFLNDVVRTYGNNPSEDERVGETIDKNSHSFGTLVELLEQGGMTTVEVDRIAARLWVEDVTMMRDVMWVLLGQRESEGWNPIEQDALAEALTSARHEEDIPFIELVEAAYAQQLKDDVDAFAAEINV